MVAIPNFCYDEEVGDDVECGTVEYPALSYHWRTKVRNWTAQAYEGRVWWSAPMNPEVYYSYQKPFTVRNFIRQVRNYWFGR